LILSDLRPWRGNPVLREASFVLSSRNDSTASTVDVARQFEAVELALTVTGSLKLWLIVPDVAVTVSVAVPVGVPGYRYGFGLLLPHPASAPMTEMESKINSIGSTRFTRRRLGIKNRKTLASAAQPGIVEAAAAM
jgi:hypothetical protein